MHALRFCVEAHVVGHKAFVVQEPFDDRMPPFFDLDRVAVVDDRLDVAIARGDFGQRHQRIDLRQHSRRRLQSSGVLRHFASQLHEEIVFQVLHAIFGGQDVRLFRLQFWRDVALGVRDRRAAFVVLGHLLGRAARHFDEEAEHLVIAHAQRLDARNACVLSLPVQSATTCPASLDRAVRRGRCRSRA